MFLLYQMGQWQLSRAVYKEMLFERYQDREHLPAQSLAALAGRLAAGEDVSDYPVWVAGQYANQHTLFWDNQMQGAVAGYHVLTVFIPSLGGPAVLVDRGWVAADRDRRRLPAVAPVQAQVLVGRSAIPSAGLRVGEEDYQARPLRLVQLNMSELSQVLGVALYPFLVRLDEQATDGFVRIWTPASRIRMGPEKHRAYAVQWFSLMGAVGLIFLAVNWRQIKPTI